MDKYWREQWNQVRDGGYLRHDQSMAVLDYLFDMDMFLRQMMNEPVAPHKWNTLRQMLDNGPKNPDEE